jgi:hypothetical protein
MSWRPETDLVVAANAAIRLGGSLVPPRGTRVAFRGGHRRGWIATVLGPSPTASDVEVRLQSGHMVPVPLGDLRVVELPEGCPELDQWERLR